MADFSPTSFRRPKIAPEALPSDTILVDQTRTRTSWFEGMFVTAAHFNRDQSHTIARQTDLGLAIGAGVVEGLEVTQPGDDPTAINVSAGLGISASGESTVLHVDLRIALADIALQKSLSREAGLIETLQLNTESRSGSFVLCATPVEFTSNPEGSYASGSNGHRQLRDSLVNEATLFTLIPFNLSLNDKNTVVQRATAARRIFLEKTMADIPPSSLPLAMMELDGNTLRWLDMHLVRRQAGSNRADSYGLGYVDSSNRAAHAVQYEAMIDEIVTGAPGQAFAAADRFDILPPMGRMPAATIAARAPAPGQPPVLSQAWLPAEVPVELTALPEDEIGQLLAESLSMPPIDLHASAKELAQTPVTVIIPIPRADWAAAPLEVQQNALSLSAAKPLGAAPKTPGDLIKALLEQSGDDILEPAEDSTWRSLLTGRQTLWYMRRRQFLRTDDLTGEAYAFQTGGDDTTTPPDVPPVAPTAPEILRPVVEPISNATSGILAPLGLDRLYQSIRTGQDRDGFQARADLDALILRASASGSSLALTEIVQRMVEVGSIDRAEVSRLERNLPLKKIAPHFVPMEAMLIGGPVAFRFVEFTPDAQSRQVTAAFARAVNNGNPTVGVPQPSVPNNMPSRVKDVLAQLNVPVEVTKAILNAGGGLIPLNSPRKIEERANLLKIAASSGTPLVSILPDQGSLETQTRRNLLARTSSISKLMEKLEPASLGDILDPLVEHMTLMDTALRQTPKKAVRVVESAIQILLQG